jgi:hypothetical protein
VKILLAVNPEITLEAYVEQVPRLGECIEVSELIYRVVDVLWYPSLATLSLYKCDDASINMIIKLGPI